MAFCTNCGKALSDGARFCFHCGAETATMQPSGVEKRKQEYVGSIKKCPACGEDIPALTAICPACGHEFTDTKVVSSLATFIAALDDCDNRISKEPVAPIRKKGFSTWDKKWQIGWIILNLLTSFVPLVIYLALPHIRPIVGYRNPHWTPEEQKKVALIENFAFPNERESILEALLFVKTKIAHLTSAKYNAKTANWMKLWGTKADQLREKAKIVLGHDPVVETAYIEIDQYKTKVQKRVRIRAGIASGISLGFILIVLINGSLYRGVAKIFSGIGVIENPYFEWHDTGLCTRLPEVDAKNGTYWSNSEENLNVEVRGYTDAEFRKYVDACEEMGYDVDVKKDTDSYEAYNDEGDYLYVSHIGNTLHIILKVVPTGDENFEWPQHACVSVIPEITGNGGEIRWSYEDNITFNIYGITQEDYQEYVAKCENAGFTIDTDISETWFYGYNAEGYKLHLGLGDVGDLTIQVDAPMEFKEIKWPSSGPAKYAPKPPSTMGKIDSNTSTMFDVYIGNMTIDDLNAYVDLCIENGFETDRRYEDEFYGKLTDEITIDVKYVGFNTVYIQIWARED